MAECKHRHAVISPKRSERTLDEWIADLERALRQHRATRFTRIQLVGKITIGDNPGMAAPDTDPQAGVTE